MNLSIIIVSWNVKEKLQSNLRALFDTNKDVHIEIFVVDNNSHDGSAAMVAKEFPQVKLITNRENLGFAKANNQAIKQANGKYILLLNPDMLVKPETISKALAWTEANEKAVVTGVKLVDEQGRIVPQVRSFPKLFDQLMIVLKIPHFFPAVLNKYLNNNFDYQHAAKVDSVRGAFFLINVEAYKKISGRDKPFLDEQYFIWFEEVDFCRQVYKLGGEVWYTSAAECVDYVGASFKQVGRHQAQQYFSDSMLKYFKKWEPRWQYGILKAAWSLVRAFI